MAMCDRFDNCKFFKGTVESDKGLGALYVKKFCDGENNSCARYIVATALGADSVPDDLYPNMADRANKIIEENK
jgi:hypothetical protein